MTTPRPALTLLEIAELEYELSKWGGEIPLRCGDVAALLAMATEHLRLTSQLRFLYHQGCCVKLKDGRVATLNGAIGTDQTALALGWTPETAESPELPKGTG